MFEMLKAILKDKTRLFGALEREIIYYQYDKKCQTCDSEIA
jgi:hypothetical protein